MSASRSDDCIVLEADASDVLLGRGNAINFREGNVRFRKLAQSKALRYATCSNKLEKDRIAKSIIAEIKNMGGRFLRPISARNEKGEHLSAWEQVKHDVALTKAKQTLRDCAAAIRRETAMRSSPSSPPLDRSCLQPSIVLPVGGLPLHQSLPVASHLHRGPIPALLNLSTTVQSQGTDSSTLRQVLPLSLLFKNDIPPNQRQMLDQVASSSHQESMSSLHSRTTRGRSQQDLPIPLDFLRAPEHKLVEEHYRSQVAAEAKQRLIWDQLSSQAQGRYGADHLRAPGSELSLLQLIGAQRLLDVQGLESMLSRSDFDGLRPSQEMVSRFAPGRAVDEEANVQKRAQSFDSQEDNSQRSSDNAGMSSRPLKKRKGLPKSEER